MIPERVARVFEKVFGVPPDTLSMETSPGALEQWDSMSHIELILALEGEFDVRFTTSEFPQLAPVGAIVAMLRAKKRLEG